MYWRKSFESGNEVTISGCRISPLLIIFALFASLFCVSLYQKTLNATHVCINVHIEGIKISYTLHIKTIQHMYIMEMNLQKPQGEGEI